MKAESQRKANIFVLIPALNEEKSIGSVIDDISMDIRHSFFFQHRVHVLP
ncbi:MAG: hypothetical protein GY940_04085 [bacterium]|nr:hypothetical protein [bacterium]